VAAARKNSGERREGAVVDQRANEWVEELRDDDVVLATVLCWRGKARVVLPTVRPKAAADGGRRRRNFSWNCRATSGRGAPVIYGEACAQVNWGGDGLVWVAHGRAVRGRSGRGRRRRNAARTLGIGHRE
jgi:hypothetical protein